MCPLISRTTSSTTCGFTPITMMSAPFTASTLLVPTFTFSFAASAFARSSCATVAQVDFAESRPFFSSACRIMPPIFPAPKNATFFPASSFAMIFPSVLCLREPSYPYLCDLRPLLTLFAVRAPLPLHPIPRSPHNVSQSSRRLSTEATPAPSPDSPPAPEDLPDAAAPSSAARASRSLPSQPRSHFLHRSSRPGPEIHRKARVPRRQMFQSLHVRARQIIHVNVVANAGSIRRRIIRSQTLATPDPLPPRPVAPVESNASPDRATLQSPRCHPRPPH